MKFAYFVKRRLSTDPRVGLLLSELEKGGATVYPAVQSLEPGTDALISFGGDGTFLSATRIGAPAGVPIVGVNLGRLGFLSENPVEGLSEKLLSGGWSLQRLSLLQVSIDGSGEELPFALNEVCISRSGMGTIGIDVEIDGAVLPTYWADGLLVATGSGSTAYNLSVGGPICMPSVPVFVVSPVAPHNLGVRPLVIPSSSEINLGFRSRSGKALLSIDNSAVQIAEGTRVSVRQAPVRAERVVLGKSNFIDALKTRFYWGQDVRNTAE